MSLPSHTRFIPIWKEAPFLRLLLPLIAGILLYWYIHPSVIMLGIVSGFVVIAFIGCFFTSYKTTKWLGISLYSLLAVLGGWLVFVKDQRNWQNHVSHHYVSGQTIVATLQEPLVNKPKSYKAEAAIELLDSVGNLSQVVGNMLVYLQKDSTMPPLTYGSRVVFNNNLQLIKSAGNPGGFDFQQYSAFNGVYYQVYLKTGEYIIDAERKYNPFRQYLFDTRSWVLHTFKTYIPGNIESGMAEALLVGYKDDLDKSLVEKYANTGVVHIIAISGMHLALIYGLLLLILKPFRKHKTGRYISALFIIAALWAFSLLTGAAPSITRSALMFTVIVLGGVADKNTGIYNSLAISAMLLLLYNPFYLWDVGFQLSYAALLSIAVFGDPITGWFYVKNKWVKPVWQLVAITLAAQILTFPLVLYHFHQFPLYFLLANMVAVPLSTIIMYGLILLMALSWIPIVAAAIGFAMHYSIFTMNKFIGFIDALPGSKLGEIYSTIPMAIMVALTIAAAAWWLLRKSTNGLVAAMACLFIWVGLYQWQRHETASQHKLIVYNVQKFTAIDIVQGNRFSFIGDTTLQQKGFLQNFNLLPSRISHQVSFKENIALNETGITSIGIGSQRMLVLNSSVDLNQSDTVSSDWLLVCRNAKTKPLQLLQKITCKTIVLDGSATRRQVDEWKNAADSLHLRLHNVQEQGAFELNL
jgi:competence protein ComEC